jgi:hypothetical protein
MDDSKEAKKWEHLEELRLLMKHVLGLMSDIVNNGLGQAFFVRTLLFHVVSIFLFYWCTYHLAFLCRI